MSRRSFTRYFQKATGTSVGEWVLTERLRRTQELLEVSNHNIETIADLVGFGTATSLRQHFKQAFGVTPVEWRKSFQKTDWRLATFETKLTSESQFNRGGEWQLLAETGWSRFKALGSADLRAGQVDSERRGRGDGRQRLALSISTRLEAVLAGSDEELREGLPIVKVDEALAGLRVYKRGGARWTHPPEIDEWQRLDVGEAYQLAVDYSRPK